jgi:hypothetical protein
VYARRHIVRVPTYTSQSRENRPETVGCAFGQHHTYRLGPVIHCHEEAYGPECVGFRRAVLAGPIVAYEEVKTPCDPNCVWRVLVRDLRTGRLLHNEPTGMSTNPAYKERVGIGPTTSIVVTSNLAGSVLYWTRGGKPFSAPLN